MSSRGYAPSSFRTEPTSCPSLTTHLRLIHPMNKLKHLLLSALLLLVALPALAQEGQGIRFFKGSFEEALKEAQRQGKPLFVDFYATWCVPCKKMEKTVFTQPEVGTYFNERFISLQLDAEKPENVETAKK